MIPLGYAHGSLADASTDRRGRGAARASTTMESSSTHSDLRTSTTRCHRALRRLTSSLRSASSTSHEVFWQPQLLEAASRCGGVAVTSLGVINEVAPRRARLVLGWVTVFGEQSTSVFHQATRGQLSLLPSAGREMSTSQNAAMLCGWGVKAGMVDSTCE